MTTSSWSTNTENQTTSNPAAIICINRFECKGYSSPQLEDSSLGQTQPVPVFTLHNIPMTTPANYLYRHKVCWKTVNQSKTLDCPTSTEYTGNWQGQRWHKNRRYHLHRNFAQWTVSMSGKDPYIHASAAVLDRKAPGKCVVAEGLESRWCKMLFVAQLGSVR